MSRLGQIKSDQIRLSDLILTPHLFPGESKNMKDRARDRSYAQSHSTVTPLLSKSIFLFLAVEITKKILSRFRNYSIKDTSSPKARRKTENICS